MLTSAVIVRSVFFFGRSSLLALYVGTGLHGARQVGEAALTTMLIAGAIGTITGGRLADKFGRLPVIRGSFAVTAPGLAAIVVTGLPWVFGAIALTGFALNQSFVGHCRAAPSQRARSGDASTPEAGVIKVWLSLR